MKAILALIFSILLSAAGGSPEPKGKKAPAPSKAASTDQIQALIDGGQFQQAASKALALARKNKDPKAYNLLGLAYRKQRKFKNAIRAYNSAIKIAPNYWEAHEYMAVAYLYLKKPKQSRKIYQVLKKKAPNLAAMLKNEAQKLGYKLD